MYENRMKNGEAVVFRMENTLFFCFDPLIPPVKPPKMAKS
jgi:hypothetical protein